MIDNLSIFVCNEVYNSLLIDINLYMLIMIYIR